MPIPQATIRQSRAQQTANVRSLSAPVGGWNARDSLDRMAETDAVTLDNWFPDMGEVRVRPGYTQHSTGMGSDVELIAEYHAGDTRKLLAAAGGSIWDATNSAASKLASGFASNRWQWVSFEGEMGLVNGSDHPQKFAGSAVSNMTISASAIGTVSSFIDVHAFKSRTYFIPDGSQDFYYSAVNSLGGTLTKFPLSRVGQFGGNILTMATWSRDAGDGMDDLAAFIMTSGEVIVYQGSNPGDATGWSLVGKFNLPRPIARRAVVGFGGDVIIATEQGYFPLSAAFSGRVGPDAAVSDKISEAVRSATQLYGSNFGWDAVSYRRGNWLLFNVPVTTNITYEQHVMNTVTGAWCRFTNIPARTWGVYNGELYFGGSGEIFKADDGANDDGIDINSDVQTAFTYLGSRGIRKQVTAIQPIYVSEGDVSFDSSLAIDFGAAASLAPTRTSTAIGATWDEASWDEAEWAGGRNVVRKWLLRSGIGYSFSVRLATTTNNIETNWYALNVLFRNAGVI